MILTYETLLAANMIVEDIPFGTINFFLGVYPYLRTGRMGCKSMAEVYGVTTQAASQHVAKLTEKQYLVRRHYRSWELNIQKIDDIDVVPSLKRKLIEG